MRFKLHIVINSKREIISFAVTQTNVDDKEPLKDEGFLKVVFGKLFADKGYISKKLHQLLFVDEIQPVTNIKSNMKNQLITISDKILLRKRSIIETTVNYELKNICQIEHSGHRSIVNLLLTSTLGHPK